MIRPYRPEDLEALKRITAICFEGVSIDRNIEERFGRIGDRDWQFRKLRHIDEDVAGDRAKGVFVWEQDGDICGYITTRIDRDSKIGGIPNLAVLPAMQGRGIGRKLLEYGLDYMRTKGMECARIETLAQNEVGSRLYPSLGFEEVARQIHYCMRL
ncbi:MAG: GNAT family N-acetyltransferase [Candidatus Latescibacteria bacterium]|jgi:ribosomal protein S18 acetylase RimI-like enzyme|nr:GNAT family N-acetyltransferase [Candidatus Latescibacterota bacterium]